MTEAESQTMSITISGSGGGTIELSQRYLGMAPYVLLLWNEDTEMFDIEAGGGVPDIDGVKQVVGLVAEILAEGDPDEGEDDEE